MAKAKGEVGNRREHEQALIAATNSILGAKVKQTLQKFFHRNRSPTLPQILQQAVE